MFDIFFNVFKTQTETFLKGKLLQNDESRVRVFESLLSRHSFFRNANSFTKACTCMHVHVYSLDAK